MRHACVGLAWTKGHRTRAWAYGNGTRAWLRTTPGRSTRRTRIRSTRRTETRPTRRTGTGAYLEDRDRPTRRTGTWSPGTRAVRRRQARTPRIRPSPVAGRTVSGRPVRPADLSARRRTPAELRAADVPGRTRASVRARQAARPPKPATPAAVARRARCRAAASTGAVRDRPRRTERGLLAAPQPHTADERGEEVGREHADVTTHEQGVRLPGPIGCACVWPASMDVVDMKVSDERARWASPNSWCSPS